MVKFFDKMNKNVTVLLLKVIIQIILNPRLPH